MTATPAELVELAVGARSPTDVVDLWGLLDASGASFSRPVGDRWGNRGLFTAAGGNFDHKLVELVTNMHDAVVLSEVLRRHGPDETLGAAFASLYGSPRSAVGALFGDRNRADLAALSRVELDSSGELDEHRRHRTVVFRDLGIGMTANDLPGALFRLGSSRKDGLLWQMGAFGRGGLTVLPNCVAWVVVTRKQPDLLNRTESDEIAVAVVRWQRVGNRQTETALYQVMGDWQTDGDSGLPFTVPSAEASWFEAGTHLAVVGFQAEGIWVSRLGDERSLDTLLDTRLFEAELPVTLSTPIFRDRKARSTILRGLGPRLADNPRPDRIEGAETLPFSHGGRTYQLPIRYFVFASGDAGSRRRFVARDHALLLNSNGQVHAHWTPAEFRIRTRLPKLADRILVVVNTDDLPLANRTAFFTADRTELLRNQDAVRLEEEVVAFLNDWDELRSINNDLVRDSILRSNADRSTFGVATRIARALQVRGFSTVTPPASRNSRQRTERSGDPMQLKEDPTELIGPEEIVAVRGRTKGIRYELDAKDDFVPRRCTAIVRCDHLDVDPATDVTIGPLRNGRMRVALAVPPDAEVVDAELELVLEGWIRSTGGLGTSLKWATKLSVVDSSEETPTPMASTSMSRSDQSAQASSDSHVALVWTSHEAEEGWTSGTVGEIEVIDSDALAQIDDQYSSLAGRHFDVPVLKLNEGFGPLKAYAGVRSREVGDEGVARAKDRYALGVGVQMFLLDREVRRAHESGQDVPEVWLRSATAAAARGVLSVLPDFDHLVTEAGLGNL